jgi:hypothetical protein
VIRIESFDPEQSTMTRARRLLTHRIGRHATWPLVLGFLVLLGGLGESTGLAQIGPSSKTSLEWMTVCSDVVAKATVAKIEYGKPIRESEVLDLFPVTVTLKVSTTFKGDPHETVQFCFEQFRETADMQNLNRLKATGQPALWFLRKSRGPNDPLRTTLGEINRVPSPLPQPISWIELGSAKTEQIIEGRRSPRGVLSLNSHVFQLLEDEDKLVRAVQAELSRPHPKPFRDMQFPVPNVLGGGPTGDGTFLIVPVTPHLAELAQGWVTSKEDWVRLAGVLALGEFKSPANAATLTKMLHDPAWLTEQNPDNTERRLYEVREAAWKILQEWKVPLPPAPVIREPLPANLKTNG